MNLGENIYRLRTQKNMSQGDLAQALDVSRQSVSKWENNSAVPELEKLIRMADLFEVSLDELVAKEPKCAAVPLPEPQIVHIHQATPGRQIAGIILLVCSGIVFLGAALMGSVFLGLLLAFPLLLNGLVCMLCERYPGFVCCWIDYIIFWFLSFLFSVFSFAGTLSAILLLLPAFALIPLAAWTLFKIYRGHFCMTRTRKLVCTVFLALLVIAQGALVFVFSGTPDSVPLQEYTYESQTAIQP